MGKKYALEFDGDHHIFDELGDCIRDLEDQDIHKIGDIIVIKEGTAKMAKTEEFVCVDDLIDRMIDSAQDQYGECAEDFLDDIDDNAREALELHIIDFFEENGFTPTFYGIEDEKEIKIQINEITDQGFKWSRVSE